MAACASPLRRPSPTLPLSPTSEHGHRRDGCRAASPVGDTAGSVTEAHRFVSGAAAAPVVAVVLLARRQRRRLRRKSPFSDRGLRCKVVSAVASDAAAPPPLLKRLQRSITFYSSVLPVVGQYAVRPWLNELGLEELSGDELVKEMDEWGCSRRCWSWGAFT